MKVAVISNHDQVGKSSFIITLASVFARTQKKKVVLLSTGSMQGLFDLANIDMRGAADKSVHVYKAVLQTAMINPSQCLEYALRVGNNNVYAYDLLSSVMDSDEEEKLFLTTLNNMKVDLTIVEIQGDLNDPFNEKVINECDAIFNVCTTSPASMKAVREWRNTYNKRVVERTGYVCQKYDSDTVSENRICKEIGINKRNFIVIPYVKDIIMLSYNKQLDEIAEMIVEGRSSVVNLRMKILEAMQFLFDNGGRKYVKGISEWQK